MDILSHSLYVLLLGLVLVLGIIIESLPSDWAASESELTD